MNLTWVSWSQHRWHASSQILRGIKSFQAKQKGSLPCFPITPAILRSIRDVWSKSSPTNDQIMLWAAFTVAFVLFLRSGEFAHLLTKRMTPLPIWALVMPCDWRSTKAIYHSLSFEDIQDRPFQKGSASLPRLNTMSSALSPPCLPIWPSEHVRQSDYCGHDFHIGAATTAGISDSMIQPLRWCEFSAYLLYIRTPCEQLAAITRSWASAQ